MQTWAGGDFIEILIDPTNKIALMNDDDVCFSAFPKNVIQFVTWNKIIFERYSIKFSRIIWQIDVGRNKLDIPFSIFINFSFFFHRKNWTNMKSPIIWLVLVGGILLFGGTANAWGGLFNRFSPEMLANMGYGSHGSSYRPQSYLQVKFINLYKLSFISYFHFSYWTYILSIFSWVHYDYELR